MKFTVLALVALSIGGTLGSTNALAKTYKSKVYAVKLINQHKLKKAYTKYTRGGLIYTTRSLKHWNHKGANYPRTKWTTNQSVTVKKSNGHKAVYYYIKNKNNGIKGWIWRGYLKDTPAKAQAKKLVTTKKSNPKKVNVGITFKSSEKKVLSTPVSNTNANGFSYMNDVRKGLQKWSAFLKANKSALRDNYVDNLDRYKSDVNVYKLIVSNEGSTVNLVSQKDLNYILDDTKFYTNLDNFN